MWAPGLRDEYSTVGTNIRPGKQKNISAKLPLVVISEAFKVALWRHRAQGGRMYRLAISAGMTPSALSATLSGARPADDCDPRIIAIGQQLGLKPEECFEPEDTVAS